MNANDIYALENDYGIRDIANMDVNIYFKMWQKFLKEKIMRIFIYEGLPFPQRELEYRALFSGGAVIVRDDKIGIMCSYASLSGVTQYTDIFTKCTYAAPTAAGGTKSIGRDAVVLYNNSLMQNMMPFIDRYASLFAHLDVTLRNLAVNMRTQDIIAVSDDATKDSVIAWYKALYKGASEVIIDDSLIDLDNGIKNVASTKSLPALSDIISSQNELLRSFYRDIGIRFAKEKKSNMIESEINADEQLLLFNVDDMLYCRQQLCKDYNNVFSDMTPISVRLNPTFTKISRGVGGNDNE